jgi:hypothetical protein
MPRIPRGDTAEGVYHIINRGNISRSHFSSGNAYSNI